MLKSTNSRYFRVLQRGDREKDDQDDGRNDSEPYEVDEYAILFQASHNGTGYTEYPLKKNKSTRIMQVIARVTISSADSEKHDFRK